MVGVVATTVAEFFPATSSTSSKPSPACPSSATEHTGQSVIRAGPQAHLGPGVALPRSALPDPPCPACDRGTGTHGAGQRRIRNRRGERHPLAGTRVAVYGHGGIGVTTDGLYQQWVSVPDHRLLELPATLDWAEGAALTVNHLTAYFALAKTGRLHSGPTVLISGATGSLGRALVQTVKAVGARPIAAVSTPHKAHRAAEEGAEAVIDLSSQDLQTAVADLTGGQGADLAMDPVGGPLPGRPAARRGTPRHPGLAWFHRRLRRDRALTARHTRPAQHRDSIIGTP
ncbi:quinone oxidoreductase family protein [Streptomyces sp. HC307]|uniref:quinone oxidoreductase family protein n=1 Tax=Streptomyces flavusporus TaxID=3385496 RepID=UPI0039172C75